MSELRDVRLQRALEHAPHDAAVPADAVSQAVRRHARQALQADRALVPRRQPWWHALWHASGSQAGPRNAAFATLVLAGFVTLLWQGREIPGAGPHESPVSTPFPAPQAPASTPTTRSQVREHESAKEVARPPSLGVPPPPSPPLTQKAGTPLAPQREVERGDKPPRETRSSPSAPPRADTAANAFPAAPASPAALAPPPPPAAAEASGRLADTDVRARAESSPATARDAAPRAAAPSLQRSAPAEPPSAAPMARPASGWDSVRITRDGQVTDLGRDAAQRLAAAVRAVIETANASGATATGGPAALRIELRAGANFESLELSGDAVRWARRSGGVETAGSGAADAASLESLRTALARIAPR